MRVSAIAAADGRISVAAAGAVADNLEVAVVEVVTAAEVVDAAGAAVVAAADPKPGIDLRTFQRIS
jgi:hypothetical protein